MTQAALVAVLGLVAWWIAVVFFPNGTSETWLPDIGRYVGAELFVVAGVLRVVCWRATRLVQHLRDGIGLAAIGLSAPALAIVAPWPLDATAVGLATPLARLLVYTPIILLLGTASTHGVFRRRSASVTAVSIAVVLTAGTALLPDHARALAVEAALAVGWLAVGVRSARHRTNPAWFPISMLVLATGTAWRATTLGTPAFAHQITAGFGLVAAVLATCGAVGGLRRALHRLAVDRLKVSDALLETRLALARTQGAERERLHDARSAVFGVLGASQLLNHSRPPKDLDRDSLQQMIVQELTRLQSVLATDVHDDVVDFDLAEALAAVLLAHQVENPRIADLLEHVHVTGRPGVTATVLDNLLRNASTHAPGASITVHCEVVDEQVHVVVEDDGPGIPAAEMSAVLFPGVRGSTAHGTGSGLGLSNCVRAMAAQAGGLRLAALPGGGTRVAVTLPTAVAAHPELVGSR